MERFIVWAQGLAMTLGGPGLFALAFLDSSFFSLPEITDVLVIWMVTQHESLMVYYVAMTTFGSVVGCLLVYAAGFRGGEAVLRNWFSADKINRAFSKFHRHGMLTLFVSALLPPPAPFKIFVLMSGVARIPWLGFLTVVGIGRGLRYSIAGILAVRYGDQAIDFLRHFGKPVFSVLLLALLVFGVGYILWRRHSARVSRP
ncbi:MAG: hypothetical protein CL879_10730 [Dehalococcoidia bacterium]|nr:hypothetical protein [Dehalococcoidia bacterium]